jgi:outer membrane lipoprotein-sorting protein
MRSLLICLPFLLGAFHPGPQQDQLTDTQLAQARLLVEKLAKSLEGVQRLHADFVQEQHSLLMSEPLTSKGRLHLRASPGCLLLELSSPKPAIVRSDSTSHQVYYPEAKKAERYLFASNEIAKTLLSILTADISEIEKAFDLTGLSRGEELTTLELRLRDIKKRKLVDRLSLTLDSKGNGLRQIVFVNAEGERTQMSLSNLRQVRADSPATERKKESEVFDRPLPEGVRLVVHSVPAQASGE